MTRKLLLETSGITAPPVDGEDSAADQSLSVDLEDVARVLIEWNNAEASRELSLIHI